MSRKYARKHPKELALYKGDKYLFGGTADDLAKYLGVSKDCIFYYKSPSYLKSIESSKNCYYVIKVED